MTIDRITHPCDGKQLTLHRDTSKVKQNQAQDCRKEKFQSKTWFQFTNLRGVRIGLYRITFAPCEPHSDQARMSNFRQAYYGKLGYKDKGAEGKLEVLLDEKKVKDLNKLKLFAEEFGVLASHRLALWGYLSNLFPIHPINHKYVMEQRQTQFQDLKSAVCWFVEDNAALEQLYFTMWMLETNRLPFGGKAVPADDQHPFKEIAKVLNTIFPEADGQYQVYWIAKAVHELAAQADIDGLVAYTYSELETFDSSLLRHLERKDILAQLPISSWFKRCFAGVVINNSLSRIWDKLFGGAIKVLVYLMLKMLQYRREELFGCDSYEMAERMFDIFMQEQEAADRIVSKAIEMLEINNKK